MIKVNEQAELMRESAKEFAKINLVDLATTIERTGIDKSTIKNIVNQGFIGANLPEQDGGAGLDRLSHNLLIFELASVSPSVAMYVLLQNNFVLPMVKSKPDLVKEIISGEAVGLYLNELMEGNLKLTDNKKLLGVIGSSPKYVLSVHTDGNVYLDSGQFEEVNDSKPLGMRGLGKCNFTVEKSEPLGEKKLVDHLLLTSSMDISSLFLGISQGALDKAMEYTKVRKTFDHPLKDYEPVAFRLTELMSELEIMKSVLFSDYVDEIMRLMLKNQSASFSRKATRYALQFHGGYGYLEDFGVEKFYRDSVALNAIIYRPVEDKRLLATKLYSDRSGFL